MTKSSSSSPSRGPSSPLPSPPSLNICCGTVLRMVGGGACLLEDERDERPEERGLNGRTPPQLEEGLSGILGFLGLTPRFFLSLLGRSVLGGVELGMGARYSEGNGV